jgi:hypothetical protein
MSRHFFYKKRRECINSLYLLQFNFRRVECCINSHDFLHLQIIRNQKRIWIFDLPGQFPAFQCKKTYFLIYNSFAISWVSLMCWSGPSFRWERWWALLQISFSNLSLIFGPFGQSFENLFWSRILHDDVPNKRSIGLSRCIWVVLLKSTLKFPKFSIHFGFIKEKYFEVSWIFDPLWFYKRKVLWSFLNIRSTLVLSQSHVEAALHFAGSDDELCCKSAFLIFLWFLARLDNSWLKRTGIQRHWDLEEFRMKPSVSCQVFGL